MGQNQFKIHINNQQILQNIDYAKQYKCEVDKLQNNLPRDVKLEKFELNNYKLIDNIVQLKDLSEILQKEKVIGMDLENNNKNSYEGYLCLMQITTQSYETYLVDLIKLNSYIYEQMGQKILQNKEITKVMHGATYSDVSWLQRDFGIQIINVIDTQELYRQYMKTNYLSLADLWKIYCNNSHFFAKNQKEFYQKEDWSLRPLSQDLLNYAAHDSFYLIYLASSIIKQVLQNHSENDIQQFFIQYNHKVMSIKYQTRQQMFQDDSYRQYFKKMIVEFDYTSDQYLLTELCFKNIFILREKIAQQEDIHPDQLIQPYIIHAISYKRPQSKQKLIDLFIELGVKSQDYIDQILEIVDQSIKDFPEQKIALRQLYIDQKQSHLDKKLQKEKRKEKLIPQFACKKAVYENCKMVAPDGELLSNCDSKKVQWYLERDLAEIISDQPLTIRLKFEPNGRNNNDKPHSDIYDDNFYVVDRKNQCVVCGQQSNYSRFHVVPSLYRQQFPSELKSHRSHDVLLLCFNCHEIASNFQEQVKKNLSEKYQIPLNKISETKTLQLEINKLNKVCQTYKKKKNDIPEEKLYQLNKIIIETIIQNQEILYQLNENQQKEINEGKISENLIQTCIEMKAPKLGNRDKQNPHGRLLVDKIGQDNLKDFIRFWRSKFVEYMSPKYLPTNWSIDHNVERSFGKYSVFNKDQ